MIFAENFFTNDCVIIWVLGVSVVTLMKRLFFWANQPTVDGSSDGEKMENFGVSAGMDVPTQIKVGRFAASVDSSPPKAIKNTLN